MGGYNSIPALNPPVGLGTMLSQGNQIRQQRQDLALGQQQQQANQIGIEAHQRDLAEQQTVNQALAQGGTLGDVAERVRGKVRPATYQQLLELDTKHREDLAKMDTAKLDNLTKAHGLTEQVY